ncbi:MAG TPA: PilZ domain-containing protein [Candidatus Acidoferrales bacterium]|nr:PilZ domain-containing protein [Candidatus Acidoferrales bacterium]
MRERRRAHRYELYMPLQVLIGSSHFPETHSAHLRDISTHGIYFVSEGSIAPGTNLDVTFTLPQETGRGQSVLVRGSGRVLRLDRVPNENGPMYGVAAAIDRFDFVQPDRQAA